MALAKKPKNTDAEIRTPISSNEKRSKTKRDQVGDQVGVQIRRF